MRHIMQYTSPIGAGALAFALLSTLFLPAAWGQAQSSDLQRCRELKDAAARLACYDAIPPAPALSEAPVAPAVRVDPVAVPAAAASAVRVPQARVEFGFERKVEQQLASSIESRIVGKVDGWEANTRFTLENGQVWQVSDDSRAFGIANNPRVKISRGMFGTFFLDIEGINPAPRVKRVK